MTPPKATMMRRKARPRRWVVAGALAIVAASCSSTSDLSVDDPGADAVIPTVTATEPSADESPGTNSGAANAGGQGSATQSAALPDYGLIESVDAPIPDGDWLTEVDTLAQTGIGNFRILCDTSHYAHDDPIVKPGQPGESHLHMFFGNTEIDGSSTYESLRTTGDSTCLGGPLNRTGYWMPAVFDAAGEIVEANRISNYYKVKDEVDGAVTELPPGLAMVAGSPDVNGFGNNSWKWSCRETAGAVGPTIPSCPVGDQVRALVTFPSCWDGQHIDSDDHRSHMAYPVDGRAECPASHPVLLPTVSYQVFFPSDGDSENWRLSSDTDEDIAAGRNGASLHADWLGAWDPDTLTRWHTACLVEERNCSWGNLGNGARLIGGLADNDDVDAIVIDDPDD